MSKITEEHLARSAYIYVRQSTMEQVHHHRESQHRQYGLKERARELGWRRIIVIDEDLGRSGSGVARAGFDRLLAAVCQGEVGAVFSIEASRLARNGRDWHTLIEFCGLVNTLLVDEDGIHDPRLPNDRLVLGLKGTMSEMELSTLRQRSHEARRLKAARGELLTTVAVGYVRAPNERLEKDPDRRVQAGIELVFKKFRELGSVRQVLLWLREERLDMPAVRYRAQDRHVVWKLPGYAALLTILRNPVYAGAYVYGRTKRRVEIDNARKRVVRGVAVAPQNWTVLLKGHHAGYISWAEYEANQAMIDDNANKRTPQVRGSARRGAALLVGLLRCGACGRKLQVHYAGHQIIRYECRGASIHHGGPMCIHFGAMRVEEAVAGEVLRVLSSAGIDAALAAAKQLESRAQERRRHRELALEQARFEAERVRRQYELADPANRLVAGELEQRWEQALQALKACEQQLAAVGEDDAFEVTPEDRATLLALGRDLDVLWNDPASPAELKKRILRSVLEEIVVDVADESIRLIVHWRGGDHTQLTVRRNRIGQHRWQTSVETEHLIRELARLMPDRDIAALLNRLGKRTAKGHTWTQARVCSFRGDHKVRVYRQGERQARGEMTVQEVADALGVSPMTVHRLIRREVLPAKQICVGALWIIRQQDLERPEIRQAFVKNCPLPPDENQVSIDFQ